MATGDKSLDEIINPGFLGGPDSYGLYEPNINSNMVCRVIMTNLAEASNFLFVSELTPLSHDGIKVAIAYNPEGIV